MMKRIFSLILLTIILFNATVFAGQTFKKTTKYSVGNIKLNDFRNEAVAADPIDLLTGNYDYKATDFTVSGRGIGISFVRTYNSFGAIYDQYESNTEESSNNLDQYESDTEESSNNLDQYESDTEESSNNPFGNGWNFNYNIRLVEEQVNDQTVTYVYHGDNKYQLGSSELMGTYGEPKGISYKFEEISSTEKIISEISDIYGNTVQFDYLNEKLDTITDTVGRKYKFSYNSNDYISSISIPGGDIYRYEYDGYDRLERFISPGGTTTYKYKGDTSLIKSIIDPDGKKRLENFYDDYNRVNKQFYEGRYFHIDYDDNEDESVSEKFKNSYVEVTERNGKKTTYNIDTNSGRATSISHQVNNQIEYDEKGFFKKSNGISYDYDDNKNLTKVVDEKSGLAMDIDYNEYNQVTNTVDPMGNKTIIEYNDNKLDKITSPSGVTTDVEMNEYGQISAVDGYSYFYDNNGYPDYIEDPEGNKTDYKYNIAGQLKEVEDARGNVTKYYYKYYGVGQVTNPRGHSIEYVYDSKGNMTEVIDTLTNKKTQYIYNDWDNMESKIDPLGNTISYEYDSNERLTSISDSKGNTTTYNYNEYNSVKEIKQTNLNGLSYTYEYNEYGRLIREYDNESNNNSSVIYLPDGNIEKITGSDGNETMYYYEDYRVVKSETNDVITEYIYDSEGLIDYILRAGERTEYENADLSRITITGSVVKQYDQSQNEISYRYYPDGSLREKNDSMGNITKYYYENGRIDKSETNGISTEYIYDSEGRLDYLIQDGKKIEYTYNELDQISDIMDGHGRSISYTYNEVGSIETMTVPGEGTFVYTYNNLNQVETITSPNNDIYTYNYDDAGRRTGITYPNGKEISYTYDEYGRVETYNNGIKNVTYIYEGNNIKEVETAKGNIVYDYDELDRLTGVSYPDGEIIKYDYDSAGNRTSKIILNKTDDGQEEVVEELIYTYDFSDRLTQVGEIRYEYDDKDRLIKKIDGDNTFDYIYNSFDQLIIVKKNGVEIASFEYDLIGRRISENINGERKEYLWAGGSLLGEYINGSLDRLYAVGNGIDEVLGIYDNSGQKEYIHSNHIGSITGVSDLDGNIVGEKEYTPFGLRRNVSGDVDTDLSFIGRKYYNEIGLTYIRARFYDPAVGRFITKDPVRDGFNWYSYCNGNPVGFVDNNGLKPIETIIDNFKLDWAGIKLLNHYLHKSPQSMIIKNDPQWSKYMMDSDNIKNYVLKKLKNINKYWGDNQITSKISILYDPQKNNKKNLQINNTGSGNGATGYDFLCGVEDFYMSGTAIKKGNRIHYNLQFNWVDTIDTKEDNFHDNKKNRVAFVYCFWNMKYVSDDTLFAVATGNGYPIEIEWNSRPIYDLNSEGGTGWPYK